jgi:uncharacterized protein YjiS (DUF1127 family)
MYADAAAAQQRAPLFARIAQSMRAMVEAYLEERAKRQTVAILSRLDDRTLKDIGIERSEICSVAYGYRDGRRWTR